MVGVVAVLAGERDAVTPKHKVVHGREVPRDRIDLVDFAFGVDVNVAEADPAAQCAIRHVQLKSYERLSGQIGGPCAGVRLRTSLCCRHGGGGQGDHDSHASASTDFRRINGEAGWGRRAAC